ncbi:hypothetical protein [Paenibacillus sp. JZ16]|uniref:hypothetical protein n=1 Tax=Paenibacillus sp. JZ16 TaxID=1906272 RepID=UPI00188C1495|nr:hypothetical protein [Paenibacillus sp. JZ16]
MKRLLIKKLIVISDVEESSREVSFEAGLNLLIGENKTGKSSLIKSIFYSFGCEMIFEDDWKKLVQRYILYFDYGDIKYCIIREKKFIKFFRMIEESSPIVLAETEHFHDYCAALMQEFEVSMDCLTTAGVKIPLTPPLLFRFQYIDQDLGWSKIGESFSNMKYIRNWKENTNKYVVGYQGEEYYKEKQNQLIIKNVVQEYNVKLKYFNELLKAIQTQKYVIDSNQEEINVDKSQLKAIFSELEELERRKIKIEDETSVLKNILYERNLQLTTVRSYIKELDKDHEFALNQEEDIICPTCGTVHKNTMFDRLGIVKDIQSGNELIKQIRNEVKEMESALVQLSVEKNELNKRYVILKKKVEHSKESASIANIYRNEGKQELVLTGKFERDKIVNSILEEERKAKLIEEKIKELNSPKRRKQILTSFKAIYEKVLDDLNVPLHTLKLKDFVQELTKTGSEKPRIIYAYHVSLYLYNLNRIVSPFNFLAIDTPNQQGQDWKNLKSIDEVLGQLLDKRGQVIIGTERETGYEEQASKVIRLLEARKTLIKQDYQNHKELFIELEKLSINK